MSGSNGRRGLSFFSSWLQVEKVQKRKRVIKALRVETLERRNLMAGDLSPHHNDIIAQDVNYDGHLTPLDALMVINDLNLNGARKLTGDLDPSTGAPMLDVSNDGNVSSLDALMVINALNSGEGVGEKVDVKYEFYDTNGKSLDPNPADNITEYRVGLGQKFVLRTSVTDIRAVPQYVFSAYQDIEMKNQDGSNVEKVALQWGEYQELRIPNLTKKGSFSIQFGTGVDSQTTAPITPKYKATASAPFDPDATAIEIQNAIASMPFVKSPSNVRVDSLARKNTNGFFNFGIYYVNGLARQNVPDPSISSTSLASASNTFLAPDIRGKATLDPSTDFEVFVDALTYKFPDNQGNPQVPTYSSGPAGLLTNAVAGTFVLDDVGGFSSTTEALTVPDPVYVFEATFIATAEGTVLFSGNPAESNEMLLFGENAKVDPSLIIFPQNIPLKIVKNITAVDDVYPKSGTILEDSAAVSLDVAANDSIFVGTSFGVTAVTQPTGSGGSVTFTANAKTVNYTPAPDFFGTTTFTYTITNNLGDSATATVTVTVTPVNDAPVVIKSAFAIDEDPAAPLVIAPLTIFNPGPLESTQTITVTVASLPTTNGTVSVDGSGNVNYTPAANFFGTALFTVTATDNGTPARSTTATLTITVNPVNDAPVPFSGTVTTAEDTNLILIGTGALTDILKSSSPGPGESTQTLSLVSITSPTPQGGTITTNAGVTTYTPAKDFFGTDTITYTIKDNLNLEATGTVTVNVTPVNDPPIAVNDSGAARFVAVGLTGIATTIDPRRNDSPGPNEAATDTIKIISVGTPSRGGAVVITNNGQSISYTPKNEPGNVNVEETFTYTIQDSGGLTATATATVFIVPPVLPFAVDDQQTVDEDSVGVTIDVLANDLFNNGATKKLVSFTQPARGTVALNGSGDKLVFTPNANVFQSDSFTYTMVDTANGSQNSTGTVVITFNEINDPPVAIDRVIDGSEGRPQTITAAVLTAGLSKGPFEDAQTLTVAQVTALSSVGGTVAIVNGDVVYTPAKNFVGQFLFTYKVQDNGTTRGVLSPLQSNAATVTVNVAPFNDPPIFVADPAFAATEDTTANISIRSLIGNDKPGPDEAVDEQNQTVSVVPFTGSKPTTQGGSISISADGTNFVYAPASDFFGTDIFVYQIKDSGPNSDTPNATLTINVAPVNDAPLPPAITDQAFKNLNRVLDLNTTIKGIKAGPQNEIDAGQTVRLTRVFKTANTVGTVSLNSDGTILYVPPTDFTGQDSFGYEVTDNGVPAATATNIITLDVKPFVPSFIEGTVWVDDNNTGTIDRKELLLGGITIVLTGRSIGESADITPRSYITLADGSYHFDDLPPGAYTVSFTPPAFLIDAPGANVVSQTILAPGGADLVTNFAVLGVTPGYSNVLENLAGSYAGIYPNVQQTGIYAAVGANGKPLWSSAKAGFEDSVYSEVVFNSNNTQVILTRINSAHVVETTIVDTRHFVKVLGPSGDRIIRILGTQADYTWIRVSETNYSDNVKKIFAEEQDNWKV